MKNAWIPVTEKLPSVGEDVLVYCPRKWWSFSSEDPHMVVAIHMPEDGGWIFETDSHWQSIEPTHWMPLPETPEGEDIL